MLVQSAAAVFALLVLGAVLFQSAIAAGAPWGRLTMGGKHPGKLPASLRTAAGIQAGVLAGLALAVLDEGGLVESAASWSGVATWVAVVLSAVSFILNLATPSKQERRVWAPVALGMLVSSLVVAVCA